MSPVSKITTKSFFGKTIYPEKICNIRYAMILLCIAVVGQGMLVTGGFTVSVNMVERSFRYNSFDVGLIDTIYNLFFGISAFFLGYFLKGQQLYLIGIGTLLISIGCILFIIPIFIDTPTLNVNANTLLCNISYIKPTDICKEISKVHLFTMILAYAIMGIGAAPLHTLSVNYIDDHFSEGRGGFFTGIYYVFASIGPVLAFLLSKYLLTIPVNLQILTINSLTIENENWIGAYWILYIIGSMILLLISIGLILFPKSVAAKNSSDADKDGVNNIVKNDNLSIRFFFVVLKKLFTNIPYILVNFGLFFEGIITSGVTAFLPKYIESQFSLNSGDSSLYSGAIVVCGATFGLFFGGLTIKLAKWKNDKIILFVSIASFTATLFFLFFLFNCQVIEVEGIIYQNSIAKEFSSQCSKNCNCDISEYVPVCIDDKMTYFSACAAGCKTETVSNDIKSYTNCTCIPNFIANVTNVVNGRCYKSCNSLIPFMILCFIAVGLIFLIYVPVLTFTMRIFPNDLSVHCLSIQQIFARVSFIIGPILIGAIIDNACSLYQPVKSCQTSSNCLRYDLGKISLYIMITAIIAKGVASVCHIIAYVIYKLCPKYQI